MLVNLFLALITCLDFEGHHALKDKRLWWFLKTWRTRQTLSSSEDVRIRLRQYTLSSSDLVQIQTKNFKDNWNDRIIPRLAKEFQMYFQRH